MKGIRAMVSTMRFSISHVVVYGLFSLIGGILAFLSGFFTFGVGPMGGEIRYFELLRNTSISMHGFGWLLVTWPVVFGLVIASCSSMCFMFGNAVCAHVVQARMLFTAVLVSFGGEGVALFLESGNVSLHDLPFWFSALRICVCVGGVAVAVFSIFKHYTAMHRAAILQAIVSVLAMIRIGMPLASAGSIDNLGLGFYVLFLGVLLIMIGSVFVLAKFKASAH